MFKFLHAADIHLDSPLRGLETFEGAPIEHFRQATRRSFINLVELALQESVSFVLLAGDLYDGTWRDYNTGLFFTKQMARLLAAKIPVFMISGNHDAANKMTRNLPLPANVSMLATDKPETRLIEDIGVAIHGQGFAKECVTDNLAERYPARRSGYFNIGLLHTCVTGREGHDRYAPCTLADLQNRRYDYWALGHIHQRETLDDGSTIHFPGNLQGRHIRETGAKGCLLVTVGREPASEFRALDVLRWERCLVEPTDAANIDDVVELATDGLRDLRAESDGRPLAVRVELAGVCPIHNRVVAHKAALTQAIRAGSFQVGGDEIWIEKLIVRTTPPTRAKGCDDGPLAEIASVLEECLSDPSKLPGLRESLEHLRKKLPADLFDGESALALENPDLLRNYLAEIQPLLLDRLVPQSEAP